MKRTKVYIAGPLTSGGAEKIAENVRNAVMAGATLMKKGYAVYIPHLTHFQDILSGWAYPFNYNDWLAHDFEWLRVCDVMFVLPGKSAGVEAEIKFAKEKGIPIYYYVDDFDSFDYFVSKYPAKR